jgi:copper chaperone CopZ
MEERLSVSAGAHCSMKINESIVKRTGVESIHAAAQKSDVSVDDKVLNTTPVNQKSIIEQSMVLGPDPPKLITNQNSNQMSYTLSNKGGGPGSSTNLTSS